MKDEMEKFFTRQVAQEGKQIPLSYPDGSESPHWIKLRGIDSDAYQEAIASERKRILDASADGKELEESQVMESRNRVLAELVVGWSFEDECTKGNVIKFLREAPQVTEELNRLAADRKYFFGSKGNGSAKKPEQKPSSKNHPQKNQS